MTRRVSKCNRCPASAIDDHPYSHPCSFSFLFSLFSEYFFRVLVFSGFFTFFFWLLCCYETRIPIYRFGIDSKPRRTYASHTCSIVFALIICNIVNRAFPIPGQTKIDYVSEVVIVEIKKKKKKRFNCFAHAYKKSMCQ